MWKTDLPAGSFNDPVCSRERAYRWRNTPNQSDAADSGSPVSEVGTLCGPEHCLLCSLFSDSKASLDSSTDSASHLDRSGDRIPAGGGLRISIGVSVDPVAALPGCRAGGPISFRARISTSFSRELHDFFAFARRRSSPRAGCGKLDDTVCIFL